ncbi:MAG: integrase core domain-containing protein [Acidobacteriota bacterium]
MRTDNEAVFTSRRFRWVLIVLGLRHQLTQVASPWQNGRVERFFGTLKGNWTLRGHLPRSWDELEAEIRDFRT